MSINVGDAVAQLAYNMPHIECFQKPAADGAAATATAETPFLTAPVNLLISAASVQPGAALVADNANNAVITIRRRDADGTNPATVASMTTNVASGNWVQFVAKAMALGAGVHLNAGQQLTIEITKGGTGVVVPIAAFLLTYAPD